MSMIKEYLIPLNEPVAWQTALQTVPHAFAHTWTHCHAMQLTTHVDTCLYTLETEAMRVVCPIAERPWCETLDIVTPYGFSGFAGAGDYAALPDHWRRFARERGYVCGYIGLNPVLARGMAFPSAELFTTNQLYVLDLTQSEADLFAHLSKGRKAQLKAWDSLAPTLVTDRSRVRDFLLDHYWDFFVQKGASAVYRFSKATIAALTEAENIYLVGAQQGNEVVAVSVFGYTAHGGDYLFNISLPTGRHFAAALLWYGIHYLKARQIPWLNLGGGVRENDGIAQFKAQFGATPMPLTALKQIYQPACYDQLCQAVSVDPTDRSGYFPPYRADGVSI